MKVSVIVCTYSLSMLTHFRECIESIINQTYKNIEIICIVDGNKEYYKIIRERLYNLFKNYNIKLYLNNRNIGLLESRNRGVKIASGDIVAFIDDDAIAEKNWIEELVKMYEDGAIAVGGKIKPLWLSKKPKWLPEEFYWMIGATYLGFPEEITEVRNTFGSNLSFRKDVFVELGGFNPKMGGIKGSRMLQGGETELCERMGKKYGKGVIYNPNAVVYHKIFQNRIKIKFLVKRAFWQGYSKAIMEHIVRNIGEERRYLQYLLTDRTVARLVNFIKGSTDDLLKLVVIWLFMFLIGVGYVYGIVMFKIQWFTNLLKV